MKISYNNYPAIKYLKNGSLTGIQFFEDDLEALKLIYSNFKQSFKENSSFFLSEINVIQESFAEEAYKSYSKLYNIYFDMMDEDYDFTFYGTYILKDAVHMIKHETKRGNPYLIAEYFIFNKMGIPMVFMSLKENKYTYWMSKLMKIRKDEVKKFIDNQFFLITIFKMFKSFASVEIKLLKPKQKLKEISCKYMNETDFEVTFLDSKWFTTLVKSSGFTVHGHFRLQPKKKDGVWTKEIIWIDEFQKTGYTAPAKIISQNNK